VEAAATDARALMRSAGLVAPDELSRVPRSGLAQLAIDAWHIESVCPVNPELARRVLQLAWSFMNVALWMRIVSVFWSICGGGGYSINAAMTERRIKVVGTVTGANYGRLMREGFTNYNPIAALERMAKQRTADLAC
jgi:hypothetical protein